MAEENFMYLGGVKVQKSLVDEYAGHVVKRLRETMRNTKYGIMFDVKDMDEILGLETTRQELHDSILEDAGFDRHDNTEGACEFKDALDDYVNKLAGTLTREPEPMGDDEVITKQKQSNDLMKYMDDMNLRMAKQRGLI